MRKEHHFSMSFGLPLTRRTIVMFHIPKQINKQFKSIKMWEDPKIQYEL